MNSKTALCASACVLNRPRCQQLAFKRGEEAFAHGVVIGVSHRTHRRAHAGLTAALAELDRGVLRTLVGMMDHARGPPRRQRHVQSIEHQLAGKCRRHRPADNAAAERIEHDGEIEKACPGRNVGDVGHPQPIRRFRREVALDQVGRLAAAILDAWSYTNLRRLTPARPACVISRATRLRPMCLPLAASSA